MIIACLLIAIWLIALFGWGVLFERLIGEDPSKYSDPTNRTALRILIGHLPVVGLGYLVHLAVPLAGWPGILVVVLGWISTLFVVGKARWEGPCLALFGGVFILVAAFCSRLMIHGDSGGYHTQAILWMAEEPVVRGLANLTTAYGYNTSWWILAALMAWLGGIPSGAALVSAPVMVATGVLLVSALLRILRAKASPADWFWVPALYLWLRQVVGVNTPSPTTDIPANLLILTAIWGLLQTGKKPLIEQITGPGGRHFLALALLASTAKLSASPLLAAGLIWLAAAWAFQLCSSRYDDRNRMIASFVRLLPLGGCGIIFLYHGWLLSGYPLFPSTIGGWFAVPWQIPGWLADHTVARTRDWAFTFGASAEQMRSTPAWRIWLDGQSGWTNVAIASIAGLAAVSGCVLILRDRRHLPALLQFLWLPVLISAVGFAWNFSQVPALRFASGFVFGLLGCGFAAVGVQMNRPLGKIAVLVWCVLCIGALVKLAVARPIALVHLPEPQPPDTLTQRTTREGLEVYISNFAWFAPKPAIVDYEFDENLITQRSADGRIIEFRGGKLPSAMSEKATP